MEPWFVNLIDLLLRNRSSVFIWVMTIIIIIIIIIEFYSAIRS